MPRSSERSFSLRYPQPITSPLCPYLRGQLSANKIAKSRPTSVPSPINIPPPLLSVFTVFLLSSSIISVRSPLLGCLLAICLCHRHTLLIIQCDPHNTSRLTASTGLYSAYFDAFIYSSTGFRRIFVSYQEVLQSER